jgi:hypothetical protein
MPRAILLAKQKLNSSLSDSLGNRFVIVPLSQAKREAIAANLISVTEGALPGFCENMTLLEVASEHTSTFQRLCFSLMLSVAQVVLHRKYAEEDAQEIMIRAFHLFFSEPSEERLGPRFQKAFNHCLERYAGVWQLSVPMLNPNEDRMYEEWAGVFASELAIFHGIPCSQAKVRRWALAAISAFRDGCYPL